MRAPVEMRHVLVHYDTPQRAVRTVTDTAVWMGPSSAVDDQHCAGASGTSEATLCAYARAGERVVITQLVLVAAQNDWDGPVVLRVDMGPLTPTAAAVTDPLGGGGGGGDAQHPDYTGVCQVRIPARHRGAINEVVYAPNFTNLLGVPVQHYVGMEEAIVGARSTCFAEHGVWDEFQVFMPGDPIVGFYLGESAWTRRTRALTRALANAPRFPRLRDDDVRVTRAEDGQQSIYAMRRDFVRDIQDKFRDAILPLIRYASAGALRVSVSNVSVLEEAAERRIVMAQFALTLLVVSQGVPRFETTTVPLRAHP